VPYTLPATETFCTKFKILLVNKNFHIKIIQVTWSTSNGIVFVGYKGISA
jgi:hypothetical protein